MREDLAARLVEDFPALYKEGMWFEHGDGWYEIIREMSIKLETLVIQRATQLPNEEAKPDIVQVKEKFGGLRVYMENATDDMREQINYTETVSTSVCELCGDSGSLRRSNWWLTSCDRCYGKLTNG